MVTYRYRYPGEEWQTLEGDSYTVEQQTSQRYRFKKAYFDFTYLVGGRNPDLGYLCGDAARGHTGWFEEGEILSYWFNPYARFASVFLYAEIRQPNGNIITAQVSCYAIHANGNETGSVIYYRDGCEFSRGCENPGNVSFAGVGELITEEICIFRVYQDSAVVLEITRDICPEVEEVNEEECPPGTCKVICGSVTCCYGSDGIAVSSF